MEEDKDMVEKKNKGEKQSKQSMLKLEFFLDINRTRGIFLTEL